MSIIITGLEMPTAGMCKTITIFDDGTVVEGNGSEKLGIAVPVPPHGDLIDRHALMKGEGRYIISFGKEGIDVAEINRAPTIIEAEGRDT